MSNDRWEKFFESAARVSEVILEWRTRSFEFVGFSLVKAEAHRSLRHYIKFLIVYFEFGMTGGVRTYYVVEMIRRERTYLIRIIARLV